MIQYNNITNASDELMTQILYYLVEDHKALASFGVTCTKIMNIINKAPFHDLIQICNRRLPRDVEQRLLELRGPSGFNGLIHHAYLMTQVAAQHASSVQSCFYLGYGHYQEGSQETVNSAFEAQRKAYDVYNNLTHELKELAVWNSQGQIVGGKAHQISSGNFNIQNLTKCIQDSLLYKYGKKTWQ